MSEFTKALLIASIYRYLLIVAGVAFAWMGYRLFILGLFEKGGELKAAFGESHLMLKQVAPGVFLLHSECSQSLLVYFVRLTSPFRLSAMRTRPCTC